MHVRVRVYEFHNQTHLLARVAQDGALELLHCAGNLVAHGGLALLVVDLATAKEAMAACGGCAGCAGGSVVGHFGCLCVCVCLGERWGVGFVLEI